MLQIEKLHSHYGLGHIIQGIDLEVHPGEVLGIFGRNGVGKTTLLKCVAGWVWPSAGQIRLDGVDLSGREPDEINRAGVAFVPEDRRIFPGLSVQENLELGLLGRRGPRPASLLAPVFDRFPRLSERRRQPGRTLSGGEQQMLAMARAMVADPRMVLIDEPTEGLAPMVVAEIFAIIRQMRAEGMIVLLVEQNVHAALEVCDRFIALERGQVVLRGDGGAPEDRTRLLKALAV